MPILREGGGTPVEVQNPRPQTWVTPNQATINIVDTTATQTLTNKTLTAPAISGGGTIDDVAFTDGSVTGAQLSANIDLDTKVLAASAAYTSNATLATLTGFSWSVVAGGIYVFEAVVPISCTTNGGIALAFKYTTATLTSIQVLGYVSTATDNAAAVSVQSTTTTDQTKFINTKTAAYTYATLRGSFVVNAAGTVALQAAQETSHSDTTTVLLGTYMRLTRVS